MASESMVFYRSWLEESRDLDDQASAILQLIEYGLEGKEFHPKDKTEKIFLNLCRPSIDANEKKKRGGAPKGNQNAKGRGAPRGNHNARKKQTTETNNLSDENEDGNVNVNEDISSGDTPPLGAGDGPADEDWSWMVQSINDKAEGGGEDDE